MKELKITNKNRRGGIEWKEYAEKYHSIGELGNFGFDKLEVCIMNTTQNIKTYVGIVENSWIVNAVGGMVDKVMLTAIQICGLKDHMYNKNITSKDEDDINKGWGDIRRLLMKGKEDYRGEEPTRPGGSIYSRRFQMKDGTDITMARQNEEYNKQRRMENEKQK